MDVNCARVERVHISRLRSRDAADAPRGLRPRPRVPLPPHTTRLRVFFQSLSTRPVLSSSFSSSASLAAHSSSSSELEEDDELLDEPRA